MLNAESLGCFDVLKILETLIRYSTFSPQEKKKRLTSNYKYVIYNLITAAPLGLKTKNRTLLSVDWQLINGEKITNKTERLKC